MTQCANKGDHNRKHLPPAALQREGNRTYEHTKPKSQPTRPSHTRPCKSALTTSATAHTHPPTFLFLPISVFARFSCWRAVSFASLFSEHGDTTTPSLKRSPNEVGPRCCSGQLKDEIEAGSQISPGKNGDCLKCCDYVLIVRSLSNREILVVYARYPETCVDEMLVRLKTLLSMRIEFSY